jgi:quinoprotein glucose dehydrogenase
LKNLSKFLCLIIYFYPLLSFSNLIENQMSRSGGGNESQKFYSLDQINKKNVKDLKTAWIYNSGSFHNVELSPILAGNTLVTSNRDGFLIGLNPSSGSEKWRINLPGEVAKRGVTYFEGNLFVPTSDGVYVIDPETGRKNLNIGNNGKYGSGVSVLPPIATKNYLITANVTSIEMFDYKTGKILWQTDLKNIFIPRMWSGLSFDEKNHLIYVVTSNGAWFIDDDIKDGGNSCSLIAINALNGLIKWKIQETKHDIWDLDVVGPPILADIKIKGHIEPVVIAVTKSGNTIFANRVTGQLIFPAEFEILTDKNKYPPVKQLKIKKPERFSSNFFDLNNDITNLSDIKRDSVLHKIRNAMGGNLLPVSSDYDFVMYGIHGGAEWPGASFNPNSNILVVPSNKYPWILKVGYFDKREDKSINLAERNTTYLNKCIQCHGPNLRGWHQGEMHGDTYVPSLINITSKFNVSELVSVENFKKIHTHLEPDKDYLFPDYFKYSKTKKEEKLRKFLKKLKFNEKRIDKFIIFANQYFWKYKGTQKTKSEVLYSLDSITQKDLINLQKFLEFNDLQIKKNGRLEIEPIYQLLLDKDGLPGSKPPWGFITAINLNNGLIQWQKPFGITKEKTTSKIINGDMNFGGTITTKSDLIIASGTRDSFARVFDINNGQELWADQLPAPGSSPPFTYNYKGCQFIVFTATGGMFLGYKHSDATVAYKLSSCRPKE